MMKLRHRICALSVAGAVAVVLTAGPAGAQGRGGGGAAPKVSTPAPKAHVSQPKPKVATPSSSKPTTPPGQAKQAATSTTPKAPKTTPVAKSGSPTPKTPKTTAGTVSPALSARLKPLFPADTDLNLAAAGFKNQGQFVAAAHVSQNLGIPFVALKTEMVENGASLGRAIQTLRPRADASAEVTRAEIQADGTIEKSRR